VRGASFQRAVHRAACLTLAALFTCLPRSSWADDREAWTLPAWVAPCPTCVPSAGRPESEMGLWARQLDTLLSEAALDLGLAPGFPAKAPADRSDATLIEAARGRWVFAPVLAPDQGELFVRITAVAPGSGVLLVRSTRTRGDDLEIQTVMMMRDLVKAGRGAPAPHASSEPAARRSAEAAPSEGRAVLALNGAALGGYVGFALQRAAGSSDARLTYPLIALGTGLGLGASMIVADEWDIGVGEAWYLSAGAWWPTFAALLLSSSYDASSNSRYVYSLGATVGGLGLSTFALTFGRMSSGGAVLTHSGGAYGTVVGGLAQMLYEGRTGVTPSRGMGWGAGIGVLSAGIAARLLPTPSASRVLLIDLAIGLGGLTGAALSSPVVFSDTGDTVRNRLFLSSIGAGMVAGAITGTLLTAGKRDVEDASTAFVLPWAGIVETETGGGVGGGVQGCF
jgi:hypothetical protein